MKLKAVWKPDACEVVAPAIVSVLKEGGSERASLKFTPSRYVLQSFVEQFETRNRIFFTSAQRRKDQAESWVVVDATKAFSTIVCESLRHNVIDLAVATNSLLFVLKYMSSCVFCAIRLSKREHGPVLRFEFNFIDTGNCVVVHDIPVEVLLAEASWSEPILADPETQLALSHTSRKLSPLIDKWRHLGVTECSVSLVRNHLSTEIRLSGASDSAKVTLVWSNSSPTTEPKNSSDETDDITLSMALTGLAFVFSKVAQLPNARPVLMASESKYLSVWLQLPYSFGVVAAVSPAIIDS